MRLLQPVFLSLTAIILALAPLRPVAQDPGVQGTVFAGETITTTAKTAVVACGQGAGSIGRKTLVVHNAAGSTAGVTVTVELRDYQAAPDFTSGYISLADITTDTLTYTTKTADSDAGQFCQVSAVSAETSTITVTLRRE